MGIRLALALGALLVAQQADALTRVGALPGVHDGRAVAVAGDLIYWVETFEGLHIADASDPTAPVELGALDTPGFAVDIEVAGARAFVADDASLQIIDVSDPTSPHLLGSFAPPAAQEVIDVEVVGGLAYLAVGQFGLHVVDVTNPSSPVGLGSLDTPGVAQHVEVQGTTAYVADIWGGLRIIDVSTPTSPVEVGHLAGEQVDSIAIVGTLAYVDDVNRLRVIDVSDATAPREIGSLDFPEDSIDVQDIEVTGSLAFLANGRAGLRLVDVSDPQHPSLGGTLLTRFWVTDVEVPGGYAYVADGAGFSVVDASEPAFPAHVGQLPPCHWSDGEAVVISGRIALFGAGCGTRVVDVTDPRAPLELARIGTRSDDVYPSALQDGLAYLRSNEGLLVYDVSDPAQPVELTREPRLPLEIWKLVLANGMAYAIGYDWLAVIDVSDPAAPVSRGALSGFLLPTGLAVDGTIAYVGDIFGLRLVDVSDVSAPVEIGSLALPGDAMSVAVLGDRVYVVSHVEFRHHLLHVIDVSNPAVPVELASTELIESPRDVAVVPGRVFVVTLDGIHVFAVSDGGALRELGAVTTPTHEAAWQLDLSGGLAFGACDDDGLCITDFAPEYAQIAAIDVKPIDARNRINPESGGSVAVAVLGSEALAAAGVDATSLRLGPGEAAPTGRGELRDVNRDGLADLIARFRKRDIAVARGATEVCLRGRLLDGALFEGCDAIATPRPRK